MGGGFTCSVCAGAASPGTALLLDSVHLYSFNSSGWEYKMRSELQTGTSGPFSGGAVCVGVCTQL